MPTLNMVPRGPAGPRQPGLLSDVPARNPRPEDGVDGDYWLNDDTTVLFRKTNGKWAPRFQTRGPQGKPGSAGAPGRGILYGAGVPSIALGRIGEWYLQTDGTNTSFLYGPKTESGWGTGTPLRGRSLRYGVGAPNNADGADGDFYIDIAAWDVYGPKAGGAWPAPASMIGPPGPYVEWTGESWNPAATYAKGDGVDHQGSSFVSLTDNNIGHEPLASPAPATSAQWQLVAKRGEPGELAGGDVLLRRAQAYTIAFGLRR